MHCPKCGHKQSGDSARFCSRCGFQLEAVVDLLSAGEQHLKREKREIAGVTLMMVTVFLLLIYFTVFGATALPHLTNRPEFLPLWITFLSVSVLIGSIGVGFLISSGFFRKLKERSLRVQLAQLKQKQGEMESRIERARADTNPSLLPPEPASVTEATTRELMEKPKTRA
jgi:hypothetical protein